MSLLCSQLGWAFAMTHVLACLLPGALKHPLRRLGEIADNVNGYSHLPLHRSDFVTSGAAIIAQYLRVVLDEPRWTVANKSQHHVCLQRLDDERHWTW